MPLDRPVLFSFGEHDTWTEALGAAAVSMVRIGVDTPTLDAWRQTCDVDDTGALLVRPDHHVAWRACDAANAAELAGALDVVAGRTAVDADG